MADARDWADAFVAQASEDLVAAQAAFEAGAVSTFCMLIQMVFEKLAKAAFGRGGQSIVRKHEVAARLMVVLRRTPSALSLIVGGEATLAAIRELEAAHPSVVADAMRRGEPQSPQLEYPWLSSRTGRVEWPAQHLPIARRAADPRDRVAASLLKSARGFVRNFDVVFP